MTVTQATRDALERAVDVHGLPGVVAMLAEICGEKAEHLRTNWQADAAARHWDRAAKVLENAAANKDVSSPVLW